MEKSPLPGAKVFLLGDSGTGKTHSIRTLVAAGIQPFVLATEPGMRSLSPCANPACPVCRLTPKVDNETISWGYVPGSAGNIDILIDQANTVNTHDLKYLCNLNDTNRKQFNQMVTVLEAIKDFKDHNGKSWGSPLNWNTDRALVLDSWTQLTDMSMDLFCGRRPAYDKSDYQVAQRGLKNFFKLLIGLPCHVVVIAHPEREYNDAASTVQLTISTIGQKLAPQLPPLVDDVIYTKRILDKFVWSTVEPGVVCKARDLPLRADMTPNFVPLITEWQRAGGKVCLTELPAH